MKSRMLANWLLNHPDHEVVGGFVLDDIEPKIETATHDIKSSSTRETLVPEESEYITFKAKEP